MPSSDIGVIQPCLLEPETGEEEEEQLKTGHAILTLIFSSWLLVRSLPILLRATDRKISSQCMQISQDWILAIITRKSWAV